MPGRFLSFIVIVIVIMRMELVPFNYPFYHVNILREIAMREELLRQEQLLEMSKTFHRKADRRSEWISQTLER